MRAITFPKTADGEWTNRETGVRIVKSEDWYFKTIYSVRIVGRDGVDRLASAAFRSLAETRVLAARIVNRIRGEIADAYAAAELTAAELTGPMAEALMNGFYGEGSSTIIRPKNNPTRKALVRRGLVHDGDNRWTALGREVARHLSELWNSAAIKSMDELHEMALAEDWVRTAATTGSPVAYDGKGGVIVSGGRSLCLRNTGAHVSHMKAVTVECREDASERVRTETTAAYAEACREDAERMAKSEDDDLVHWWASEVGQLAACGVRILHTPYTYGSPELSEVTCKACLLEAQ